MNTDLAALLKYRMEQAHDTLEEAEILFEKQAFRGTINRAYYAMFYALLALLATKNLGTSKHSGAIGLYFEKALSELTKGLNKNSLDEFKLYEYQDLYERYKLFLRLLQFVLDSRITLFKKTEELPHLPISEIIYTGANISMMNELCCKLKFSFSEYQ